MSTNLSRVAAGLAATAAAGFAWAGLVERRWHAVRHVTVPALNPTASRPLRVLHLSDLHLTAGQEHTLAFVRRCADLRPDLLVATGDLLETPAAIDEAIAVLSDIADVPAVAVLGSHDYYAPSLGNPLRYFWQGRHPQAVRGRRMDTDRLVEGLTKAGWEVLVNRRVTVDTVAGPIDVVGLDDPHIRYDDPLRVSWEPPLQDTALRLGLVHAPYTHVLDRFEHEGFDLVLEAVEHEGFDLALCGHTHGGQVRVPGFGALVNNCDLPLRQSRGLSRHRDRLWLNVSAGLGTSKYFPFRFACRPEVTVLDLVPAPPAD